jgi:hypothetical protein
MVGEATETVAVIVAATEIGVAADIEIATATADTRAVSTRGIGEAAVSIELISLGLGLYSIL